MGLFTPFAKPNFAPFVAKDASTSTIQKVKELYQRAGTEGEKAAAKAALERMGAAVPPERLPDDLKPHPGEHPLVASARWEATVIFKSEGGTPRWRAAYNKYQELREKFRGRS